MAELVRQAQGVHEGIVSLLVGPQSSEARPGGTCSQAHSRGCWEWLSAFPRGPHPTVFITWQLSSLE